MAIDKEVYQQIIRELKEHQVTLVAVSKTKPVTDILELYELGQRDFGENYVQELVTKAPQLPPDIRWHYIGHLQTNKVKYIAPFVHLIHGVDSIKLLQEINRQAAKNNRVIDVLIQIHIAEEETKFGLNEEELNAMLNEIAKMPLANIHICGLMGMASFTDDKDKVRGEFKKLKNILNNQRLPTLSMGMSSDYKIAIEEGSTMVRIGSIIFGTRN